MDKSMNWLRLQTQVDQHLDNAHAAQQASWNHFHDQANGIERVVDRHLKRIARREIDMCDFCQIIADSPAMQITRENDFLPEGDQ